jgi:hypothetical protein
VGVPKKTEGYRREEGKAQIKEMKEERKKKRMNTRNRRRKNA